MLRLRCSTAAIITLLLLELARAQVPVSEAELVAEIRTSILSLTSQTRRQRGEANRDEQHNITICFLCGPY